MLLVTLTIGGTPTRISDQALSLEHFWTPAIFDFGNPQRTLPTDHGGYCRMNVGDMSLAPSLFSGDWPPPKTCAITVEYTTTTEAVAVTIYAGLASRRGYNHEKVEYTLKAPDYDETEADTSPHDGTLNAYLTNNLLAIAELSTLNADNERGTSPDVDFYTEGEQLQIEECSAVAAFNTHMFYISGSTAYLIDMLLYNGSRTITEFEFFPPSYWDKEPIAQCSTTGRSSEDGGDVTAGKIYSRFSAYPHGRQEDVPCYNDTIATIRTALDNIMTIENRARCSVWLPLDNNIPDPGEKISWTDTRLEVSTDVDLYARTFRYDLKNGFVEIEGDAVITAT